MTHSAYRIFALTFTISAMRAVELHVENFRGIQSAALTCGALTALVGRNGAGKSTFLHALDLFYRPTAAVSLEDFSYRRTDGALVIRVTYERLQPEELTAFATYIRDGRLIVTKRFQPPAAPLRLCLRGPLGRLKSWHCVRFSALERLRVFAPRAARRFGPRPSRSRLLVPAGAR